MQELCQPEAYFFGYRCQQVQGHQSTKHTGRTLAKLSLCLQLDPQPICNLTAQQSHKELAEMIFRYIDIYYITYNWIGRHNVLLFSNSHNATHLAFFSTVFLLQSKNWIQVEVTSLFPRMSPRLLSFKVAGEAMRDGRGELLHHIFLYLIGTVT